MVGKRKSSPWVIVGNTKLFFSQLLEVIPCCSGPAPIIMVAQLVLELDGSTALACMVEAPSLIILSKVGVTAFCNPLGLNPSNPMTTTCFTLGPCSCSLLLHDHNEHTAITIPIVPGINILAKALLKMAAIVLNVLVFNTK